MTWNEVLTGKQGDNEVIVEQTKTSVDLIDTLMEQMLLQILTVL